MSHIFYKGDRFKEEGQHVELKEIKGGKPVDRILALGHQYAVAFLNAEAGSIFWGVTDDNSIIKGVELNEQDRNKILTILSQKIRAIQPSVPANAIQIYIHEVLDKALNIKIDNLYVVEVKVSQGAPDKLYFTGDGQAFIKRAGEKAKLDPQEINEEIERRCGIQLGPRENISALFSQVNWRHVRIMPLYPPVPFGRVQCNVLDEYRVFFSLPANYRDYLDSSDPRSQSRLYEGRFAPQDEFKICPSIETHKRSLLFDLIEQNDPLLEKAKQIVFSDYMTNRRTIKFNGQNLGLSAVRQGRTSEERPELTIDLFRSDYYSYRVMGEFLQAMSDAGHSMPDYVNRRGISDFGGSFQQGVHLAAGIAIILHTLRDNRFVITRRSANSTNTAGEAGKLFMSANEGLNVRDIHDGGTVNLTDAVQRAFREELLGGRLGGAELPKRLRRIYVTGAYLYAPTFSVDLCIYAAIDCSLADIKKSYLLAPDSLFETDGFADCPTATLQDICQYLTRTLSPDLPSSSWDEGALTAFLCAALCLRET